ncbi:MAG: UDP-N-acetylglucosamine--N-acetylmuramyl-(pentapeptide) pyrophosphoryl-undecaprenol N-acetylglucosamine transferase [Puniceicoccales bacterium]|jgi:UDP-N-acetylglucosamine--N-acetylmuramyl-(pentapeptide) pyrophosphoryl-undecaprenol N-acetylglucosamine transferase|nr:UDP-N-acetylglucosamine--N-acetylmuramyl-(pentapeptide) pyrophosphoryl-undecaprenol N-acetylglucosamine transferase [Puniceicoccales bacterium]
MYAIACGGTGGHLSPGIAVAEELIARGERCLLIVSEKLVDSMMLRKYDSFEYITLGAKPLPKSMGMFYQFARSQVISFFKCLKLVKQKNIHCIIGMGGFTSVPVVLAAFVARRGIILHESNRIIGRTIKILAWVANRIFLPDGVEFRSRFLNKKTTHAAIPLRKEICRIDKTRARENLGIQRDGFVLTVLGGSQGANALNDWAYQNFVELNSNGIAVCCICGVKNKKFRAITDKFGGSHGVENSFLQFCSDMQSLLSASDLLLCRAGAGTIAEATHCSVPMVLVPYPDAADNHQEANAIYAEKKGLAVVVRQNNMEALMNVILKCFREGFRNFVFADGQDCSKSATDVVVDFAQNPKIPHKTGKSTSHE